MGFLSAMIEESERERVDRLPLIKLAVTPPQQPALDELKAQNALPTGPGGKGAGPVQVPPAPQTQQTQTPRTGTNTRSTAAPVDMRAERAAGMAAGRKATQRLAETGEDPAFRTYDYTPAPYPEPAKPAKPTGPARNLLSDSELSGGLIRQGESDKDWEAKKAQYATYRKSVGGTQAMRKLHPQNTADDGVTDHAWLAARERERTDAAAAKQGRDRATAVVDRNTAKKPGYETVNTPYGSFSRKKGGAPLTERPDYDAYAAYKNSPAGREAAAKRMQADVAKTTAQRAAAQAKMNAQVANAAPLNTGGTISGDAAKFGAGGRGPVNRLAGASSPRGGRGPAGRI